MLFINIESLPLVSSHWVQSSSGGLFMAGFISFFYNDTNVTHASTSLGLITQHQGYISKRESHENTKWVYGFTACPARNLSVPYRGTLSMSCLKSIILCKPVFLKKKC